MRGGDFCFLLLYIPAFPKKFIKKKKLSLQVSFVKRFSTPTLISLFAAMWRVMKGLLETNADTLSCENSPLSWDLLFHFLLFSLSVVSAFSQPHELQHARLSFHLWWCVCYWSQWCTCGTSVTFGKRPLELYGCACLDFINTITSFLGKIRLLSGLWLRHVCVW